MVIITAADNQRSSHSAHFSFTYTTPNQLEVYSVRATIIPRQSDLLKLALGKRKEKLPSDRKKPLAQPPVRAGRHRVGASVLPLFLPLAKETPFVKEEEMMPSHNS